MDNSMPANTSMQQSSFPAYVPPSKRSLVVDDILDPTPLTSSSSAVPSNSASLTASIYGQPRRPPSSSPSARSSSEGAMPPKATASIPPMSASSSAANTYGTIGDRRRSSARLPPPVHTSSSANLNHELDRSSSSVSTAMADGNMQHIPSIVRSLCMSPNLDESYARLNPNLYPFSTSEFDRNEPKANSVAPLAAPSDDVSSSTSPNVSADEISGVAGSIPPSTSNGSISAEASSSASSSNGGHSSLLIYTNTNGSAGSFQDSPPNFRHLQHRHLHLRDTSSSSSSTSVTTPLLDLDSPAALSSPGGINGSCYTPKEDGSVGGGQIVGDYFSGIERTGTKSQEGIVGHGNPGAVSGGAVGPMQYGDGSRRPSLSGGYGGLGLNIGHGTGEFGFGFEGMGGPNPDALGRLGGAPAFPNPVAPSDGSTPTQASVSAQRRQNQLQQQLPQDSLRTPTAATFSTTSTSETATTIAELQAQIEELKLKQAILDQQKAQLMIGGGGGPQQQHRTATFPAFPVPPPSLSGHQPTSFPPPPTYYTLQHLYNPRPQSQYASPYGNTTIGLPTSVLYHNTQIPLPSPSLYAGPVDTRAAASTMVMGLGMDSLPPPSVAPSTKHSPNMTSTNASATTAGGGAVQPQGTRSRNVSGGKGRHGEPTGGARREGEGEDHVSGGANGASAAASTGGTTEPINFMSLLQPTSEPPYRQLVYRIVRNMDQQASIFIQQKLKSCSTNSMQDVAERRRILDAILSMAFEMMVQKALECDEEIKVPVDIFFALIIVPDGVDRKCLPSQRLVLHELLIGDPAVTLINKHASHVWSRIMELTWSPPAPPIFAYVNNALRGRWVELATHETGSLVVQHLFENCVEEDTKDCLEEIFRGFHIVVKDQWGSFVIQHMLEHGLPEHRSRALSLLGASLLQHATDAQAIKSIDKALKVCPEEAAEVFVTRLCEPGKTGRRPLIVDLALNNNGSQLITQLAPMATLDQRKRLDAALKKHVVTLKGNKAGSRIVWMFERMRPNGSNGAPPSASATEGSSSRRL
ncbi:hypothetical protein FS837_007558 [Tulasnella sp. UAMH 9824]|nr:hypothetical protein FS837_007558 [Tulasnella sp. UAMH 9824]